MTDISWITPQTTILEYVIRTRKPGWRVILDETATPDITVYSHTEQTVTLHPDMLWQTLEANTKGARILPPNHGPERE